HEGDGAAGAAVEPPLHAAKVLAARIVEREREAAPGHGLSRAPRPGRAVGEPGRIDGPCGGAAAEVRVAAGQARVLLTVVRRFHRVHAVDPPAFLALRSGRRAALLVREEIVRRTAHRAADDLHEADLVGDDGAVRSEDDLHVYSDGLRAVVARIGVDLVVLLELELTAGRLEARARTPLECESSRAVRGRRGLTEQGAAGGAIRFGLEHRPLGLDAQPRDLRA